MGRAFDMLMRLFGGQDKEIDRNQLEEEAVQAYRGRCPANEERIALLSLWKYTEAAHHRDLLDSFAEPGPNNRHRYWYLQCLTPRDKLAFQREVIERLMVQYSTEAERREFILSGDMDAAEWRSVMSAVDLSVNYQLWRFVTMYEKCGPPYPKNSNKLSRRHIEFELFPAKDADRHTHTVKVLWAPHRSSHLSSSFRLYRAFPPAKII